MVKEPARQPAGFYAAIEHLLQQRLQAPAAPVELRLKLIEVFYETGRSQEFLQEVDALGTALDGEAHADDRARIASMGRELGLTGERFQTDLRPQPATAGAPRTRPPLQRRLGDDGRYRETFAALAPGAADAAFAEELDHELQRLAQRPTPLYEARTLTSVVGGARILLKREDLGPANSRLLVAVAGQALLARRLGRSSLVTSTLSGSRGVVTAAVAAQLGLKAVIFIDRDDLDRHRDAAFRMRLHGAELRPVTRRELPERDVRHAALAYWAQQPSDRFAVMGLDAAPSPYGLLTREIPSVIGRETRRQVQELTGALPDVLVARGGDHSDAIGFFEPFLTDPPRLVCVAPSRDLGIKRKDELFGAAPGPSADTLKRIARADLTAREHAPVMREHGFLRASGRVEYVRAIPETARKALLQTAAMEGLVASIDTAQALGWACATAAQMTPEQTIVVMFAETGDTDLPDLMRLLNGQV